MEHGTLTPTPYIFSAYEVIAEIDREHNVFLVQNIYSKKIFIEKILSVYSIPVYQYIKEHPIAGMPKLVEIMEYDGKLIVIEEYISGDSLQYILENQGVLEEKDVILIGLQLCRILRELHHASPPIIHRDVKPGNVIIDGAMRVTLLDINAARQVAPGKIQDTQLIGTVGYAAPEQYGFAQSGPAVDIYAVGTLMNVLCTGEFPSQTLVKGRLGKIIEKCTQTTHKSRYRSMDELLRALENLSASSAELIYKYKWKRFLPPGLRSLELPSAFFALAGYLFTIYFYFILPAQVRETEIQGFLITLGIILFDGNYLCVQEKLPLTKSLNPWIKLLGILLYNAVIVLVFFLSISVSKVIFY